MNQISNNQKGGHNQAQSVKISAQQFVSEIESQKDIILQIAKQATGLSFKYVSIKESGRYGENVSISCSGTDDDLGFFGHYISSVVYGMTAHIKPSYNENEKIWFSSGVDYTHKEMGSNGCRDSEITVTYNLKEHKFEVIKEVEN